MSNKFTRNIYKDFENLSDPFVKRHINHQVVAAADSSAADEKQVRSITSQIHKAVNRLRSHGWLDLEEFRLPGQFIDTRALVFKLDELFDQMPRCISDQKELAAMHRTELRPLIEKAIEKWESPPEQAD